VNVTVAGVDAWVRAFTGLTNKLDTPELVDGAAHAVAAAARRLAPTSSGHPNSGLLRRSITVRPVRNAPTVYVGPWVSYSTFVHEGTARMRARPFLSQAVRAADPADRVDAAVDAMMRKAER
jgi:HK97 gp10 family phage protein